MLELSYELKRVLDQELNYLKVITRSGQGLINIKVNVIEKASLLKDPGYQVSDYE
jgi:hypothetical protein